MLADAASRFSTLPDWHLPPATFRLIVSRWGLPEVDLFASAESAQVRRFYAWGATRRRMQRSSTHSLSDGASRGLTPSLLLPFFRPSSGRWRSLQATFSSSRRFGRPRSGSLSFWISTSSMFVAFQQFLRSSICRRGGARFLIFLFSLGEFSAVARRRRFRRLLPPPLRQLATVFFRSIRRRLEVIHGFPASFS